jgi:NADH-quinone oxidoreductase subunit C
MTSDENVDTTNGEEASEIAVVDSLEDTIWPLINRVLSSVDVTPERGSIDLITQIPRSDIIRALQILKDNEEVQFNYLRCLTAVDNESDGVDVVYHVYSIPKNINLTVKVNLPVDDKTIGTATEVWEAANWLERETAEMFGITFKNHPDPRTLLMPEDMTDTFPLLKSHPFAEIEILQGELLGYDRENQGDDE